jgi:iron complex transport system ATP-binding protein
MTPSAGQAGATKLASAGRPTTVLSTAGLAVGYRGRRGRHAVVLAGLDLALEAGRLTCLLGPNGSGKSTLLRSVVGLQRPLAGTVRLGDDDLRTLGPLERARRLAVVLTEPLDAGLLRAEDLVALGRYPHTGWAGRLTAADHAVVDWALHAAGAFQLRERPVVELSDGERQRVLIARALAQQPAVLALDEPVAFVDVARRIELVRLLGHLARECGLAVLLTTHDLDLALRTADTVWLIEGAAGGPRVLHAGAPEDLALDGAVARAFAGDGVRFDHARGTFLPETVALARYVVHGPDPAAHWAGMALQRAGLAAAGPHEHPHVVVTATVAGWRVEAAGAVTDVADLAGLVALAPSFLPTATDPA